MERDSEPPAVAPEEPTVVEGPRKLRDVAPDATVARDGSAPRDPTLRAPVFGTLSRVTNAPRGVDDPAIPSAFDTLGDRFEERGELGRGGMGRVADSFDRTLGRQVAIKHMLAPDADARARFEREVRITARLEHPGIVPIYEAGRAADGNPYYVMRRIDGRPLHKLVEDHSLDGRLALVPNLLAACDAVAYAHARSIVHRDIKPTNILVGPFGETLVIDWGLARELASKEPRDGRDDPDIRDSAEGLTRVGSVAGTPGYMSPEQARGESAGPQSDVFALGATLFYLLAGTTPFAGSSATEALLHTAANRPPDWRKVPGEVPDDLRAIMKKAMAIDREDRYGDAGALAADLRRFVTGNLVAAHRYTRVEQLRRFVRRHRAAVTIAAIALGVLAVVAWIAIDRVVEARDQALAQARATEVAREGERARADDATLAQARRELADNPALAVAIARPLADGPRWRDVRDIGAAARMNGVPWRLSGSANTWSAGLSPSGLRAFTVGGDGAIRLHDLPDRTTKLVHLLGRAVDRKHPAHVALLDDDRLAVFDDRTLAFVDTRTKARQTFAVEAPAMVVVRTASTLYWIDANDHAFRIPFAGATLPQRLPVDGKLRQLWVAPDDETVFVSGLDGTWQLVDGVAELLTTEHIRGLGFSSNGYELLVKHASGRLEQWSWIPLAWHYLVTPLGNVETNTSDTFDHEVALVRVEPASPYIKPTTRIFVEGPYGSVGGDSAIVARMLAESRDDMVVAAAPDGPIVVVDHGARHALPLAGAKPMFLRASPRSSYVLLGTPEHVLAFDLDGCMPRHLSGFQQGTLVDAPVGPHRVLVSNTKGSEWLDLLDGTRAPGPVEAEVSRSNVVRYGFSPSGKRVILLVDGELRIAHPNTTESTAYATGVGRAVLLDDRRVLIAASDRIELVDLETRARRPIAEGKDVKTLLVSRDYVGAAFASTIERVRLADGSRQALGLSAEPVMTADGRVWFADGPILRSWKLDGTVTDHVTLPSAIRHVVLVGELELAIDTDEIGYLIDAARPGWWRRTMHLDTLGHELEGKMFYRSIATASPAANLLVVPGPRGGGSIIDAATAASWPFGQTSKNGATAKLSPDGRAIYERRDGTFAVWRLGLPTTPAETKRWIDSITNAKTAADGGYLEWPAD